MYGDGWCNFYLNKKPKEGIVMFKNFNGFHLVDAYHNMRLEKWFQPGRVFKKTVMAIVVVFITLLLWNLPSSSFGIEGLNVVQQRIIAIFAFATLMWVFEVVPSWATSVAIIAINRCLRAYLMDVSSYND